MHLLLPPAIFMTYPGGTGTPESGEMVGTLCLVVICVLSKRRRVEGSRTSRKASQSYLLPSQCKARHGNNGIKQGTSKGTPERYG